MSVRTTSVQVSGITWIDNEDNPITEVNGRQLPTEVCLQMDATVGDWSQSGLEDQVVDLLRQMYGATAAMFYLQY